MSKMSLPPNNPTQIELFPKSTGSVSASSSEPFVIKDLTLSAENIIVLVIIFIVTMVVFFSFGVERGKRLVKSATPAAEEMAALVDQGAPMEAPHSEVSHPRIPIKVPSHGVEAPVTTDPDTKEEVLDIPIDEEFRYTIQVASFKSEQYAQKEAKILEKKGYESFVMPKGQHQIVCVGRFAAKAEAKEYAYKIKDRYQDYLIRSR